MTELPAKYDVFIPAITGVENANVTSTGWESGATGAWIDHFLPYGKAIPEYKIVTKDHYEFDPEDFKDADAICTDKGIKVVLSADKKTVTITGTPNTLKTTADPVKVRINIPAVKSEMVTVTLDANGGTFPAGAKTTIKKAYNTKLIGSDIAASKPTLDGYEIEKWVNAADGSAITFGEGSGTQVTSDITIKPVWKAKTVTITFFKRQGVSDSTTQTIVFDKETALKANSFTGAPGYLFIGWATEDEPDVVAYKDGEKVLKEFAENTVLYGVWVESATVEFTLKNNNDSNPVFKTSSEYKTSMNVEKGKAFKLPLESDISNPSDATLRLKQWIVNVGSGNVTYNPGAEITITANTTITAEWEAR